MPNENEKEDRVKIFVENTMYQIPGGGAFTEEAPADENEDEVLSKSA